MLRPLVRASPFLRKVSAEFLGAQAEGLEQRSDRLGLVGFQLALEEALVGGAAVLAQPPVLGGEETADQRRGRVVDLERTADDQTARLRPAPRIEVGVARLVFRVEAALALALDAQLERDPAHAHAVALLEREGGVKREIRVRTLVVRVHLYFLAFHCLTLWTRVVISRIFRCFQPPRSCRVWLEFGLEFGATGIGHSDPIEELTGDLLITNLFWAVEGRQIARAALSR